MQWKTLGIFICAAAVSSCGKPQENTSQVASFYGVLEIDIVPSDRRGLLAQSVGSLQQVFEGDGQRFAAPYCSAVRISRTHLLTARHCVQKSSLYHSHYFASLPLDGVLRVETFDRVVRLMYDGSMDPRAEDVEKAAPILDKPVFQNEKLDFAIISLTQENLSEGAWINLETAQDSPVKGTTYLWGHPHGVPLTQATCHQFVTLEGPWLGHDCDAASGSSGGLVGFSEVPVALHLSGPGQNDGVFYRETNEFESPEMFARKRGCPESSVGLEPSCLNAKGYNRALPLTKIRAVLKEEAPLLWKAINADQLKTEIATTL